MSQTPPVSDQSWPGERLGLPASGSGSIARFSRRLGALVVDWGLSVVVSIGFFSYDPLATLAVFAVTQWLFLSLANASIGHLVFRMRLIPISGGWIGVWRPLVRTLLLCVVIPALIWNRDQRGLHDVLAGTVLIVR